MSKNSFNFNTVAKEYLAMGFSVIPIGRKKRPLIKWEEFQYRRPTEAEIDLWSNDFEKPNIGIVTGDISGVVVVDVEAGGDTKDLPPTVIAKTGGGGFHFYYKHPGFTVKNATRIRDLTDIRADGGYVVVPPSNHASGNAYEWLAAPGQAEMIEAPAWALVETSHSKIKVANWQEFLAAENGKGNRNATAAKLAGKLLSELSSSLWEVAGWPALRDWNNSQNKPPLPESELRAVWDSIMQREQVKAGSQEPEERHPIGFEALEAAINKWLLIKDPGIIKVLAACVLANRLKADPVWLFIVTASGGTKTELLRGLNKIENIYPISDLTPQSFLSGEKSNKNASLLLRLPSEVIITMKDFTTVLTMHRDKRHAILSQLREIYDGQFKKEFGTGESKEWVGKLGFIAGVTSVIDHHYGVYQTLGERFVQYRPDQPDPIQVSLKAIGNSGSEIAMREEIQTAFANFVAGIEVPEESMSVPDDFKHRIAHLAAFCVRARSGVIREGFSSREIELIPEAELPTRLAKQLLTLLCGLALVSGSFEEADYALIYKIGMDTLPQNRRRTIERLLKADEPIETVEVALAIGYPTNTTRRILEDLSGLKLINRKSQGKGMADLWSVCDETRRLIAEAQPSQAELLEQINQVFFDGKGIPEMSEGLIEEEI